LFSVCTSDYFTSDLLPGTILISFLATKTQSRLASIACIKVTQIIIACPNFSYSDFDYIEKPTNFTREKWTQPSGSLAE